MLAIAGGLVMPQTQGGTHGSNIVDMDAGADSWRSHVFIEPWDDGADEPARREQEASAAVWAFYGQMDRSGSVGLRLAAETEGIGTALAAVNPELAHEGAGSYLA